MILPNEFILFLHILMPPEGEPIKIKLVGKFTVGMGNLYSLGSSQPESFKRIYCLWGGEDREGD